MSHLGLLRASQSRVGQQSEVKDLGPRNGQVPVQESGSDPWAKMQAFFDTAAQTEEAMRFHRGNIADARRVEEADTGLDAQRYNTAYPQTTLPDKNPSPTQALPQNLHQALASRQIPKKPVSTRTAQHSKHGGGKTGATKGPAKLGVQASGGLPHRPTGLGPGRGSVIIA